MMGRSCVLCGLLLIFILLFFSCDILRDGPYEVVAWTPGEGYHGDPGRLRVSLLLSLNSNRAKTEQAFSLTEDGKALKGYFSWEGKRLVFIPAAVLETDRHYVITLETAAQDTKGLSLESRFEASFSTRPPGGKPRLIGAEPEHEGSLSHNRGEVRLFFSEPVQLNSCMDHISFVPSTPGSWRLEDNGKTACFTPRDPWQSGSLYRVRVDRAFAAIGGAELGSEYTSVFYAGTDREKPVLLNVLALLVAEGNSAQVHYEDIPFEKQGGFSAGVYDTWERFTRLGLVFSKPVDLSALGNFLVIEPNASVILESPPEMADTAVFRFAESPAWGTSFNFRLAPCVRDQAGNESDEEYSFRIRAAGPLSKPPVLAGIRLPMAPGNSEDPQALSFSSTDLFADLPIEDGEDRYRFNIQTSTWIELYFEVAPETDIDPFSLMDLFRVESTNQALVFSGRSIRMDDFSLADPGEGWEDLRRFEIRGFLTNSVHSGIVTFRIPPGLKDERGNRSGTDFRISLLK